MTYPAFDPDRPDVSIGSRKDEIDKARNNLTALQDMMAGLGFMDNFDITISAGTADVPTEILATNSNQIVKIGLTYGSGVTAGLVTVITLSKSTDTGGSYDSMRTGTISYDGSGGFVSLIWS